MSASFSAKQLSESGLSFSDLPTFLTTRVGAAAREALAGMLGPGVQWFPASSSRSTAFPEKTEIEQKGLKSNFADTDSMNFSDAFACGECF